MNKQHSPAPGNDAPGNDAAPPPPLRIELPAELPRLSPAAAATLLRILLKAARQDKATLADTQPSPPDSAHHDAAQAGDR